MLLTQQVQLGPIEDFQSIHIDTYARAREDPLHDSRPGTQVFYSEQYVIQAKQRKPTLLQMRSPRTFH